VQVRWVDSPTSLAASPRFDFGVSPNCASRLRKLTCPHHCNQQQNMLQRSRGFQQRKGSIFVGNLRSQVSSGTLTDHPEFFFR
jgi:hypothetical protein